MTLTQLLFQFSVSTVSVPSVLQPFLRWNLQGSGFYYGNMRHGPILETHRAFRNPDSTKSEGIALRIKQLVRDRPTPETGYRDTVHETLTFLRLRLLKIKSCKVREARGII